MTIQERLKRSNLIMLVVPVAVAGVLLAVGLGMLLLLLETVYLPHLGLTMQDLHALGEQAEVAFADLKRFIILYGVVVIAVLLAAVVGTNLWLTQNLFVHIRAPLTVLMQGIQRIQNGDLNAPIAYDKTDEFRPACDAVDEMAARLRASLAQQQREQQKKQELIAGMPHDLKSPLDHHPRLYRALLEGVAPDETACQRYFQTIYARETDLEALVNRLFGLAKLGASEYPVPPEPLPLREIVDAILADCDPRRTDVRQHRHRRRHCAGRPRTAWPHFAQPHRQQLQVRGHRADPAQRKRRRLDNAARTG